MFRKRALCRRWALRLRNGSPGPALGSRIVSTVRGTSRRWSPAELSVSTHIRTALSAMSWSRRCSMRGARTQTTPAPQGLTTTRARTLPGVLLSSSSFRPSGVICKQGNRAPSSMSPHKLDWLLLLCCVPFRAEALIFVSFIVYLSMFFQKGRAIRVVFHAIRRRNLRCFLAHLVILFKYFPS